MAKSGKQENELPPSRRNRARAVGGDIRGLAQHAFARAGFNDSTLLLCWEQLAGPETARFAWPMKFVDGPDGGVLTIKADAAASVFLQHQSRELCARINTYLGRPAVKRLRFVFGDITPRKPRPIHRSKSSRPPEGDPSLHFDGPKSLREALVSLAGARRRPAHENGN